MKKILALIMALAMVLCLAACGGNGGDETTAPAGETVAGAEDTTAAAVDATEAASGEDATATSDEASTEAATDAEGNTVEATEAATQAGAQTGALTKAQFVALLNADTAKIAKSGSYSFNRNCSYIKNIDVGGSFITGILNGIIKAVDKNSSVDSVVGGFLGIGTKTGTLPKDKADADKNYLIKATTLNESDLASFSESNGVYTFTLASATNPKKTGATPLSRFTNDFITHEEVDKGIKDNVGDKIVLKSSTVTYKNIKATVTVKDGKIVSITYYCEFDAALKLGAAGVDLINGTGAAKTTNTYSNIKY